MENIMRNDGLKLRERMKSKGFDMKGLANKLNVSRVAIEKDLQKQNITRRSLVKYVPLLVEDIEEFYTDGTKVHTSVVENNIEPSMIMQHKEDLLAAKDEIIREQRKHIETLSNMLRFFPNAVQPALANA